MDKVALIVGGGRSLGAYISKHLASEGYKVAIADLNLEQAKQVAEDIGKDKAMALEMDATQENQVAEMTEAIVKQFGRIDLLIYNAGIAVASKIVDFKLDSFKKIVDVNLTGYFLCAREVSKVMIEQNIPGCIIQINSKSGKVGSKHNTGYSSAKFGGVGLTQSLALDLAEHNIRVHSMMLGNLLDSDMFESLIPQYAAKLGIPEEEVKQHYIDKVPLKRGCSFQDVAETICFYASEKATYMTGQAVNITGGQVMF